MSEVARVRLGVTMQINVPVLTDGDEVSLVGRNISAIIVAPNRKQYMLDFTLDGEHMNKVKAVFEGMIHEVTGLHRIMIVENLGKESQTLFDMDAVNLVARSSMASALDSSLPTPVVQLSGGSLFVGGKGGEDGVGISSIQFVGHVTGGNKYKILLTSGAEYFFLANDGQDGQDGHTPYIQDKYWYINGESTGIKADYSDEEAARQSAYQAAEANRNGAYEDAENDRDEDFVASEAQRQQEFTQAEAARNTSVQAAQAAAEDAAESAQEAVQKFTAIKDAIDALDPSQSTSDAIVAEAAARSAKDAELEAGLGQLGPKIDQMNGIRAKAAAALNAIYALLVKAVFLDDDITAEKSEIEAAIANLTASVAAPEITIGSSIVMTCETSGAAIHYTTDGSTPTSSSAQYSSPLALPSVTTTYKAIAIKGGDSSAVVSATYTFSETNIHFADTNVKSVLLANANINTNGDNEISYDEAAAVSNNTFGTIFKNNTSITSFDEFQYFGVTQLASEAFKGCTNLESIVLPAGYMAFGTGVFYGCSSLASISIPSGVTSTNTNTFYNCTSLSSVTLPNGLETIGNSSFNGCSALASISIPSSVTTIGQSAFAYCSSLASITLPSGLTSIGSSALSRTGISTLTIPSGVTEIPESLCSVCTSLTTVSIEGNITSVGKNAFYGCTALQSVTIKSNTMPTMAAASYINSGTTIYVPSALVATYQADSVWGTFTIQAIQ